MIASYFTDACGNKVPGHEDRLLTCSRVICHLMRSWTGLIYLSTGQKSTLSLIVDSLKMPLQGYRTLILEMFFEILRLEGEQSQQFATETCPHLHFFYHFKAIQMILLLEAGILKVNKQELIFSL